MSDASETARVYAVEPEETRRLPRFWTSDHAHHVLDGCALGVYTGLRTYGGRRFFGLEPHLDRTDLCMERLGWPDRLDRARVRRALHEVALDSPFADSFLRLDVLAPGAHAGEAGEGAVTGTTARTLITLAPFTPVPGNLIEHGVGVGVSRELNRVAPLVKHAQFAVDRRPFPLGEPDAYEHLLVDGEERVLEGTSSNVFCVRDDTLVTAGAGVLEGITRRFVLECSRELGLAVLEEAPALARFADADEAFLSSSTRGVVPIVRVEGRPIGSGGPGPWTRRLAEHLAERVEREAREAWPHQS